MLAAAAAHVAGAVILSRAGIFAGLFLVRAPA
jgi:hypothetical protein